MDSIFVTKPPPNPIILKRFNKIDFWNLTLVSDTKKWCKFNKNRKADAVVTQQPF